MKHNLLAWPNNGQVEVIGRSIYVKSSYFNEGLVPARVDTGAKITSVWASNIFIDEEGKLNFCLFDEGSPYYNGTVWKHDKFKISVVRNSTGQDEIRYRTIMPIQINERKLKTMVNLSDRSANSYPILIGRRTIRHRFIVDTNLTSVDHVMNNDKILHEEELNEELIKNPYLFHQKYSNLIPGSKKYENRNLI